MPSPLQSNFERHGFFVSRETLEKLETYEALLRKWQRVINLVGPNTLDDIPERHFFDSAQLFRYMPIVNVRLVDLGSGAGFPGLVLAMLGVSDVHLVESDIRKATFLREVSRETGTPVVIHDVRIEDCKIEEVDVITARALSPLTDLLTHVSKFFSPDHPFYCLFAKGLQYREEIETAKKKWIFEPEIFPSETDISGKILRINEFRLKPA